MINHRRSKCGFAVAFIFIIAVYCPNIFFPNGGLSSAHAEPGSVESSASDVAAKVCGSRACFAPFAEIAGVKYPLRGIALFEYWSLDIYSAAFYAPREIDTIEEALSDVPKLLVLNYHRGLTKDNIIENSNHVLGENPTIAHGELKDRFEQFYQKFADVKDGDRFGMRYQPGVGTTLLFNNREETTITGDDFQKAYFGIWLSRYSVDQDFTESLIGIK